MILKYANLKNMWDVEITEYLYTYKRLTNIDTIPYLKTKMICNVYFRTNNKKQHISTANPSDLIPFVPGYLVKSFSYDFSSGHISVWFFDKNDTTITNPNFYERLLPFNEVIEFFKDDGNE